MEPRVFGNLLQIRGSIAFGCSSLGFPWGRPANIQTLVGSRRQHEPLQVRLGSHWHPHAAGSLSIPHSSLGAPASQAPGTWHRSHQTGPGERNSEMFSLFVLWLELVDTLVTILMAAGFFVCLVGWLIFVSFLVFHLQQQDLDIDGNGNPLRYSCLENPRDRGAWWAAVYGVTQSWTLKRLSSSSRNIHSSWLLFPDGLLGSVEWGFLCDILGFFALLFCFYTSEHMLVWTSSLHPATPFFLVNVTFSSHSLRLFLFAKEFLCIRSKGCWIFSLCLMQSIFAPQRNLLFYSGPLVLFCSVLFWSRGGCLYIQNVAACAVCVYWRQIPCGCLCLLIHFPFWGLSLSYF